MATIQKDLLDILPGPRHELYKGINLKREFKDLAKVTPSFEITDITSSDFEVVDLSNLTLQEAESSTDAKRISTQFHDTLHPVFSAGGVLEVTLPASENILLIYSPLVKQESVFSPVTIKIKHSGSDKNIITHITHPLIKLDIEIGDCHLHQLDISGSELSAQVFQQEVTQKEGGHFHLTQIAKASLGKQILRKNLFINQVSPKEETILNHLSELTQSDARNTHDFLHILNHEKQGGVAHQNIKSLVGSRNKFNFSGLIRIHNDAPQTESFMSIKNSLYSKRAQTFNRPWLEIDTDDVICEHGSSTGLMSDEELFYLQSRGLTEEAAKLLLRQAQINDILGRITSTPLREIANKLF